MKKIIIGLMTCCIFLLSGCVSVSYKISLPDDYVINEVLAIELDSGEIYGAGYDVLDVKADIISYIENEKTKYFYNYQNNIKSLWESCVISSELKNALSDAVTFEYKIEGNKIIVERVYNAIIVNDEIVVSPAVVYYYYNYGEVSNSSSVIYRNEYSSQIIEKTFTKARFETMDTIYNSELAKQAEEYFGLKYSTFSTDDVEKNYSYGTRYHRVHSDANDIKFVDKVYVHTWKFDGLDDTITLYRNYVNVKILYSTAIGLGILVTIISFIFFKRKLKKSSVM